MVISAFFEKTDGVLVFTCRYRIVYCSDGCTGIGSESGDNGYFGFDRSAGGEAQ